MALGDGIRRNIAAVDPTERTLLRDALIALNQRFFPGNRTDAIPGGVSWWFKQDEIHQATHVHGGPEFLPWHREIVNRLEGMLRQINPQLSLHYWDWTQDPRAIPNANLGGGATGTLNLFTPDFMGYGGSSSAPIGEPWLRAGYYVPGANPHRDATGNPADPPNTVVRFVSGSPASVSGDDAIVNAIDYPTMRNGLERVHDAMHGFVNMGSAHVSFRDPFVFLLHSNVDRLFARWQTDPAHPERLDPNAVYGSESGGAGLNNNIRPWSGVPFTTRPWAPPENQHVAKNYKHTSVVTPPRYDTNFTAPLLSWNWSNMGKPASANIHSLMGAVSAMDTPTSPQRPHLFVAGNDGNLWCLWSSGSAWNWLNMGRPSGVGSVGVMGAAVSVMDTPTSAQRPHLFLVGNDANLWCRWSTGSAWNWSNLGKPPSANIQSLMGAVSAMDTPASPQRPHLFVAGNDGNLWCLWWSGSAWNWLNMGRPAGVGSVGLMGAAVSVMDTPTSPQRPYLFLVGNDANLWCRWSTGSAWNWSNLGKPPSANIQSLMGAVSAMDTPASPQRPHLFVAGNDGNLWCLWWSGSAWNWLNMGRPAGVGSVGLMGAAVSVMDTPASPKRPYLFLVGNDANLWCRWSTGSAWNWSNLGKPPSANIHSLMGAVTVMDTPTAPQRPHLFVAGNDGNLWVDWWG